MDVLCLMFCERNKLFYEKTITPSFGDLRHAALRLWQHPNPGLQ